MSSSISNWKTPSCVLTVWSSRSMRASPAAGDRPAVLLVEDHRQQPVLGAVRIEDVRERGRDHGVEAVVLEAPDGVLAGGARAEVPARDQDRVRLELDLARAEPVVEEELAVARALVRFRNCLGMIWSVSTSWRSSTATWPSMISIGSMASSTP